MVCLLILVQHLNVVGVNVASPLHVEVLIVAFDHIKTSVFARVHHSIVNVRRILNFKRHEEVVDLIAIILANTISCPLEMHIARVWEKCGRWSVIEDRL